MRGNDLQRALANGTSHGTSRRSNKNRAIRREAALASVRARAEEKQAMLEAQVQQAQGEGQERLSNPQHAITTEGTISETQRMSFQDMCSEAHIQQ